MKNPKAAVALFAALGIGACGDDLAGTDGGTDGGTDATGSGISSESTTTATSATTSATTTTTTTSSSGSTTGMDDQPLVCNPSDDLEPNNAENNAFQLPNITDEDGSGDFFESILAGDQDIDWYWYKGTDVAFAYVDPTATLATEMSLRLCIFVECRVGTTPPVECDDSIDSTSPENRQGCCSTGKEPFVMIDLTCDGSSGDDSANVYMRVDRGHADKCVPYDLTYHF